MLVSLGIKFTQEPAESQGTATNPGAWLLFLACLRRLRAVQLPLFDRRAFFEFTVCTRIRVLGKVFDRLDSDSSEFCLF